MGAAGETHDRTDARSGRPTIGGCAGLGPRLADQVATVARAIEIFMLSIRGWRPT
jgi:hypothetical protein